MRDKNGCITCRVRQKKCSGVEPGQNVCGDCQRLNIQCLGVQHNRPDWLRNPEALKETKHRIKHFLTEYPVPRGRGPAPERPHLDFLDLIQKYSPRVPSLDECKNLTIKSERLYRMEPDSPPHTGYLNVQSAHYTPSTPSPSSSYAAMPRTPSSADGSLFTTDMQACNYPDGMFAHDAFMAQPVGAAYHEMPYVPYDAYNSNMVSAPVSPVSPYRHDYSQTLIITSPVAPFPNEYLSEQLPSPSARR